MAKKKKYYVVWQGNQPGIYESWTECQLQIKGFPNAKYKSFSSLEAAKAAYGGDYESAIDRKTKAAKIVDEAAKEKIIWKSISVDAACSGNPGVMEYQGVDTATGFQFFYQKFSLGTNNIGEFLAIVHCLAMQKKQATNLPIYSDSKIAIGWVKKAKVNTKLARNSKTKLLYDLIERGENWLKNNDFRVPILKWETKEWGEIPADFGRK
ncbi:MAG: ribonuclease H family protein [Bacteroidota bacterium]